jgi:RNA polymerase sigma-70 factor (ECF subfamily)
MMGYNNSTTRQLLYMKAPQSETDLALISSIAKGDTQALDVLYARHGPGILNYLIGRLNDRQLAEEMLQDVFLAVWQSAHRFQGKSKVYTWLISIARHKAINASQRQRTPQTINLDDEIHIQQSQPVEFPSDESDHTSLRNAIQQLPPAQRETLELVFYHQFTERETAKLLGIAPGTVKSRLHRAKMTLRKLLHTSESTDE